VEEAHDDGGDPVDAAFLVFAAHAEVLLDLAGDRGGELGGGFVALGGDGGRGDGAGGGVSWSGGCFGGKERGSHRVGLASFVSSWCFVVSLTSTLAGWCMGRV